MQSRSPLPEASTDFTCPNCGASAFEVVAEPSECKDDTDSIGILFAKCFGCDHLFRNDIRDLHMVMADTMD